MKIIILITIVCLHVPCFVYAQDGDALLRIEGTVWSYTLYPRIGTPVVLYLGFYEGHLYYTSRNGCFGTPEPFPSTYIDLPGIGLFWDAVRCVGKKPNIICFWRTGVLFPFIDIGIQWCIGIPCPFQDHTLELVPNMSLPEDFCS